MGPRQTLLPLAVCWISLDRDGRYLPKADTDGPAAGVCFPDDPQRPEFFPSLLEPLMARLIPTVGTLPATLAALAGEPQLAITVPDAAQSAAFRRRAGRDLVSYQRIPQQVPALQRLFDGLGKSQERQRLSFGGGSSVGRASPLPALVMVGSPYSHLASAGCARTPPRSRT